MDNNQIEQLLISAGLSEKEAKIYLFLLAYGPTKAADIFDQLGMKKGNTYALLENLVEKKMVLKNGTKFSPQSPVNALQALEQKSQSVSAALESFRAVLPQINSNYKLTINKPTIQYFEGVNGLIEIFHDVYAPKDEPVLGAVDVRQIEKVFSGMPDKTLVPDRQKTGLAVKCLFNKTEQTLAYQKKDKEQNRTSLLVDGDKYPLPADIEVYQDRIALMSFKQGEFMGLIIQNEEFATTVKSLLRYLFDSLSSARKRD